MGHPLPPNNEILRSELDRLYEKRLVVDELIRNLERYAEFESRPPVEFLGNPAVELVPPIRPGIVT